MSRVNELNITKPDDLSSNPWTHRVERTNQLPQVVLWPSHDTHIQTQTYMHAEIHKEEQNLLGESWVLWLMPIILQVLGRVRQEGQEFKVSLNYKVKFYSSLSFPLGKPKIITATKYIEC